MAWNEEIREIVKIKIDMDKGSATYHFDLNNIWSSFFEMRKELSQEGSKK